jgi:GH15 family glucan-1,4-alpha-glucosidase
VSAGGDAIETPVGDGAVIRDDAGYAPIRDYAAIGDGRTVALVARDGAIDWLPLPDLDSPAVFGAILDADKGGRARLEPAVPYAVQRRYLPDTNVLETTFTTSGGVVRVTDALVLHTPGLAPLRELVRVVEGVSGTTAMRWSVEPRFGFATPRTSVASRDGVVVAASGADAIAVSPSGVGEPEIGSDRVAGTFDVEPGSTAMITVSASSREPLVFPARDETLARLEHTRDSWSRWVDETTYDGPFPDAVVRSGLALKLLVFAPSGAIAGAATTSLPEEIGGARNWDYRFSWIRDAAFVLGALLELGCSDEATAYFWWMMNASQITHPRLHVLYRLDGGAQAPERALELDGYRGSRPVRVGNAAVDQLQLDIYGSLLRSAWLFVHAGHRIDRDVGKRLAQIADLVTETWTSPDSGIWEVRSEPRHFTQSKIMCWAALDRAIALASGGHIPSRHVDRWRREAERIRTFVDERCWSERQASYVRSAGSEELDASILLAPMVGFADPSEPRMRGTVDAIDRELRDGPFVRRYGGEDGVSGEEGAFLACSFWFAEALARAGRVDGSGELLEELVHAANDVGLYAEEVDPRDGAFLGNFPQALSHLALIGAAAALGRSMRGAR